MTLQIRRGKLPSKLIAVVQAEYNEKEGTAVVDVPNYVDTDVLEPYMHQSHCEEPRHGTETERYFEAKDVKRFGLDSFTPRLEGTLLGQDGSADFVLYF